MRNARLKFFLVATIVTVAFIALAQDRRPQHPDQATRFANAANRWMLEPVDLNAQKDTTTPDIRSIRDAYWDRHAGQPTPLSQPANGFIAYPSEGGGSTLSASDEFPTIKDGVWLIGTFESYRTFLSAGERAVYTEINIRVHDVFGSQSIPGLADGALIDVAQFGGTIVAPWGGTYTYQVQPRTRAFRPGHIYLVLLAYKPAGGFYLPTNKRWDLTNGVAEPDTGYEIDRARSGKSQIVGQGKARVIELLRNQLRGPKQ